MSLFDKKNKDKKLVLACKEGNLTLIKKYLGNPTTNINYVSLKSGDTPLHKAVKFGNQDHVNLLLEQPSISVNVQNKNEESPLFEVIHKQGPNMHGMAQSLVSKGASVRLPNKHQQMPLHIVCKWGNKELVTLFLDQGADVNATDKDDNTPLHFAADNGFAEVVEILLDAKAAVQANKAGLTPVQLASSKNHHNVLAVFDRRGGNVSTGSGANSPQC